MLAQLGTATYEYRTRHIQLQPTDVLVLATDGFTDAMDPQRKILADEGTIEWIQQMPATS